MNLVQIQNRLRDVPIQALMAYANGANPEVPPYLALGEMDRRKRMEQAAQPAQPPQGTVKEQVEQQAGLMALMKARQAQAAQQPFIPSQGVPQPSSQREPEDVEMLMAAGGVTALPVRDEDFEYAGGGIVAFAEGSDKKGVKEKDEEDKKELRYVPLRERAREQMEQKGSIYSENFGRPPSEYVESEATRALKAPFRAAAEGVSGLFNSLYRTRPAEGGADIMFGPQGEVLGGTAGAPAVAQPSQAALDAAYKKEVANRDAAAQAAPPPAPAPAPAPAPGPTPRPTPTPPPSTDPFMKYLQGQLGAAAPAVKSAQERIAEEIRRNPQSVLAQDPYKYDMEAIANLEARRQSERERFQKAEEDRARRDFYRSLIAAGQATRGQKGIGALFGGYGRAAMAAEDLAEERRNQFEALDMQRQENAIKLRSEIQKAQIARAEGRFKDAATHEMEVQKLQQKDSEIKGAIARTGAEIGSREREGALDRANRLAAAAMTAERASNKGMMTYDQAADNVDKRIQNSPTLISKAKAEDKAAGRPVRTADQIRTDLINEELRRSESTLPGAPKRGELPPPPPQIRALLDKYK